MGSDEKELATAMRTSASGLVPPTGLVAGGIARGRRMKLVRRIQVGTSAAAVLAVAGTTLALVSGTNDEGGRQQAAGPASSTSVSATPVPPTRTPKSQPTLPVPAGMAVASPQFLLQALLPKLPAAVVGQATTGVGVTGGDTSNVRDGAMYSAGSHVELMIEDAKGPTLLSVSVGLDPHNPNSIVCPPVEGTNASCSDSVLADGSRLLVNKNWVYPASANTPENIADDKWGPNGRGPKEWSAHVVRPDGVQIIVDEIASREEKGEPARDTPLLRTEQLQAIATDPGFLLWVAPSENATAAARFPKMQVSEPLSSRMYPTSKALPDRSANSPSSVRSPG
ncbi:hypothetical protein [Streptomyces sp. SID3343]|uniref:hypothetical protein n=1 Tax=Streptomyces sp. SID3343 TaxID=2690260 RepID=UPI00136BAD90|nr:hypothetical protein [Streptomyces sp. SID3343]MYW01182.1 hypothetical protein [Streptomyces sp. SID3343]